MVVMVVEGMGAEIVRVALLVVLREEERESHWETRVRLNELRRVWDWCGGRAGWMGWVGRVKPGDCGDEASSSIGGKSRAVRSSFLGSGDGIGSNSSTIGLKAGFAGIPGSESHMLVTGWLLRPSQALPGREVADEARLRCQYSSCRSLIMDMDGRD